MADDDGLFVEDDVEEPPKTRCGHKRPDKNQMRCIPR